MKVKLSLKMRIRLYLFILFKKIDKWMDDVIYNCQVLWKSGKKMKQAQKDDDFNEYARLIRIKLEAQIQLLGMSFMFILLILFTYLIQRLEVPMNLKLSIVGIYLLLNILENRAVAYENYTKTQDNQAELKHVNI